MKKTTPKLWTRAFYAAVNPETLTTGIHTPEPGWESPPLQARLNCFDLWYVSSGEGAVRIDDVWQEFEAGDLITIKPGSAYQRERAGTPPFHITFAHLLPFGKQDGGLNDILADIWPLKMSLLHRPETAKLFTHLFEAHATRPGKSPLTVQGTALQLLDMIFEELQGTPSSRKPRAFQNLLWAKEMIETRYADPLKLADITEHSGLSASYLSAIFKYHLGCSPIEYLIQVRIREAKLLLARGRYVKEAAYATGFESQHYFSRLFKQKTGLSPTAFASKHKRPASRTKN